MGGSIAGCAAAVAVQRAGHTVTVFERSRADLAERGLGIVIPPALREKLVSAGYVDAAMPVCTASERVWVVRRPGRREGRELWRQPSPIAACNWALLWQSLRRRVSDGDYRRADRVAEVHAAIPERPSSASKAEVHTDRGQDLTCDMVVGADGYGSLVRGTVFPRVRPSFAGYALWRASLPLRQVPDGARIRNELSGKYYTIVFPGGHAVLYLIPGSQGDAQETLRLNWALYAVPPTDMAFDATMSYPPGRVAEALVRHAQGLIEESFPDPWRDAVLATGADAVTVQPVHDLSLPRVARAPFLLAGDASTITRPHTASGAVKALQDALLLEQVLRSSPSLSAALAAYDEDRRAVGNQLVSLGRALGQAQVEDTPDWQTMSPQKMAAWTLATLNGKSHYLYEEKELMEPTHYRE
ncbi:FAD-dependent monooxygenase [Streptomyces sp. NPDC060209]|uniref:FAD-dependent monooxygenase n=1 Tax=Streptomyces sp. NPDC060209 TaxID=3347073 RepID=UPI003648EB10